MTSFTLILAVLLGAAPAAVSPAAPAAPAIVGVVTDSAGDPLSNATILVAEMRRTTTTNIRGEFSIRGLPAGEYHLNVTRIGYAPGHAVVRVPIEGPDVRVTIALRLTPLRLSSVVISASPTGTETEHMTQTALELSGAALARSVGSSVASTLAAEPGVNQRFAGPAASMPVIRGLTGDRILMLQDGERSGDLASSAADHAVSVDPLAAQRIEVVRGPASLLYGNNALGGVVNVISNDIPTAVPSHLEGTIAAQSETATPGGAVNAGLTSALGARSAFTVRAGYRDMGDLRTGKDVELSGTDSRTLNGTIGYGFIGERGNAGIALKAYDFEYGIPAAEGDAEAGIRIDGRRTSLSARGGLQLGSKALPYLRFDGGAQDYTHDEIEPDGAVGTTMGLRTQTLNAQGTTAFGTTKGAVGIQGLFKQYSAEGEEALTPAANSSSVGVFVFQELPIGGADPEHGARVQVGGRFDTYRIVSKDGEAKFGPGRTLDFNSGSGSLGASVPLGETFTLSGSVARAFRAPTVEELFSNAFHHAAGTFDVGNPDLRAELSTGGEIILRAGADRVNAQLSAYVNRVQDYITPDIVGDTLNDHGELVPLNHFTQGDAELRGVEGSVEVQLTGQVVANVSGDLVRGAFVDGDEPLPFMPPARVGGGVRWDAERWSLGGEVRHGFAQDRVTGGDVDVPTDAYTLVNLNAGYHWLMGNALQEILLRVDNVGDARYFDSSSRIKSFAANPGRNVSVVYRLTF
jgi:iron complex outermembrane receptor protein